jgi:hypothetical protein
MGDYVICGQWVVESAESVLSGVLFAGMSIITLKEMLGSMFP